MAKEQGKEKRIHPLNWRDALVRWGGWGGEAEVSVTRFFSQRVYFIMLWGTIWRNMTIVSMIMLRHKSIIAGAVACLNISQIRSLLPMLLLLPPLRMFDSSNCVYWGTLSMLWRLISKAEVAFGFVPPIIILKRMQQTHVDIILDVLYYPLIEPTMNMPLALLIHLISIPIDANIGLRTGAQTDYLTATVVNMLALVVRILWAVHQRRQFIRQHALLMLAEVDEVASSLANEHLLVPIHGGSMSTMTTTITAGSVGDNEEEKLPEYRSGCSIMAGSVGDNKEETLPEYESGSSDTEYDDPLRGLEHMMVDGKDEYKDDNDLAIGCVPELTEAQAPESVLQDMYEFGREFGCLSSTVPVTVYIPWSDPADLGANAITNVTSKLQELLPDFRVLRTTVRKGSLILTFDLIYVGATPELDPLECIQSTVPTQSWVQWLDLPWPKDGEKVMVQVGDQHTVGVTWDLNAQCWVVGKVSAVGATLHPVKITSVEPQVLSFPKSMEPVQLNIGVKSEVSRKLLNPSSDMQLRARYMKRAVPLYLHPIEDQLETEVVPSLETASSCGSLHEDTTILVTLHMEKILSAGEAFQPGLLILELWRHRTVAHSVPVLVVAGKDQELMWEWSTKPEAKEQLGNSGLLQEQTIRSMGLWLEFVTTFKAEQRRQAPHLHPLCDELKNCMLNRALILLMSATYRGWLYTASEVLEGLLVDCAVRFEDVAAACTNRQTLLHAAAMSGKAYMVAAVIKWGDQNCRRWSWTQQNNRGITPLHMVACSGNPKLTASILDNFSQAREAWDTCKGKLGYTPAAFADRVNLTREAKPSPKARGRDSLEQGIVRCASPLSSGMPRATSLSRAPQAAASVAKGVVPAIDNMHTAKGVVPATDSMQTDLGGVPWVTSLSCAPQAGASLHIEKRVVPATDSMHVEKGGVPATDSMHVEKGVVPKTDSMHIEKRVVPATDSMHVEKGVVPATNSMHVEKGVVPATDSMHVDKGRVPAMDTMHIEKGLVPATGSMHVKKGRVPAHEADPCPPPYTRISSGTDFMDSDATVAMSKILEERRTCSAFEEKALDEVVLKRKGELAKAGAAELNSKLKSSSVRETVKSLVSRLGLKLKKGASLLAVCTKSP